jgi:hypothetical protein
MAKKFFIRRTQADLVQEQNRLLETLLAKQDVQPSPQIIYRSPLSITPSEILGDQFESIGKGSGEGDFFDEEDDVPFIPITATGEAQLSTVDTNKVEFDESGVEKLKKTRTKAIRTVQERKETYDE